MEKYVFSGKTEEEALENALSELSLEKKDILYETQEQKGGLFKGKKVEITESVKAAFNGETGRVTYFERTSENPYNCEIKTCDVSEIANIEKKVPTEWICDGYVTDKIVDYIRPLIQGEVPLAFSNGLPKLLRP